MELKSCPFCGSKAELVHISEEEILDVSNEYVVGGVYYVICDSCGVSTPMCTEQDCVGRWNARVCVEVDNANN